MAKFLQFVSEITSYRSYSPGEFSTEEFRSMVKLAKMGDPPLWSRPGPLPSLGSTVDVRINSIGKAVVVAFFVEDGFVGLYLRPLAPPAWYVNQNGAESCCHIFGSELRQPDE